jgi:hypothetical protein
VETILTRRDEFKENVTNENSLNIARTLRLPSWSTTVPSLTWDNESRLLRRHLPLQQLSVQTNLTLFQMTGVQPEEKVTKVPSMSHR